MITELEMKDAFTVLRRGFDERGSLKADIIGPFEYPYDVEDLLKKLEDII